MRRSVPASLSQTMSMLSPVAITLGAIVVLCLTACVVPSVHQVMVDMQTELVVFCVAIFTHRALFGQHEVPRPMPKSFNCKVAEGPEEKCKRPAARSPRTASSNASATSSNAQSRNQAREEMAAVAFKLIAASRAGDHDEVISLYESSGLDLSTETRALKLVVEAAFAKGRKDLVVELVAQASESAQVSLVKGSVGPRRLQEAVTVFKACPGKTAYHYNALLDVCSECGDMAAGQRVMAEAKFAGKADVVTYNTIIKFNVQNGNVAGARKLIADMRSNGLEPNQVTFNEMLHAMAKSGEAPWTLVDEMKECGLKPNGFTCSILLKCVQKGTHYRDVERTLSIAEEVSSEDMDEILLSSIIEACVRSNRADLLTRILERQRNEGDQRTKGPQTYGSIIRAYGFIKDIGGVWAMWREMRGRHIVPTSVTMGCMVEALIANGHIEAGCDLVHELMADPQTRSLMNAVIYCSVLKGLSHKKRFDRVWTLYQEMLEENLQFSIVTYNTLVDACARNGEMSRIPALLKEMTEKGIDPNVITYSTIVKGYCLDNRLDMACELLETMKTTIKVAPDEITYNTLLDGCARHGLYEKAMGLLADMQEQGVAPSNFTLSVLVKLARRSNQLEKAFEFCEEISKKYRFRLNIHVYNNLLHACSSHGDINLALEVFERFLKEKVRPDARTYNLLLRGCIEAGKIEEAASLLRAALGLPGAYANPYPEYRDAMQPRGGLPDDTIYEVLEMLAEKSDDMSLAVHLFKDMRAVQHLRIDARRVPRMITTWLNDQANASDRKRRN